MIEQAKYYCRCLDCGHEFTLPSTHFWRVAAGREPCPRCGSMFIEGAKKKVKPRAPNAHRLVKSPLLKAMATAAKEGGPQHRKTPLFHHDVPQPVVKLKRARKRHKLKEKP